MALLPLKMPWNLSSDRWATILNPVLQLSPNQGLLLKNVALAHGVTVVNHLLQRQQQGWIIVDQDAQANIYRSAPFNNLTLTLTSDAACNVSLWVF